VQEAKSETRNPAISLCICLALITDISQLFRHMHVLFLKWILSISLLFLLNTTCTEKVLGKLLLETSAEVEKTTLLHQVMM